MPCYAYRSRCLTLLQAKHPQELALSQVAIAARVQCCGF
jgi:hypothetical protein